VKMKTHVSPENEHLHFDDDKSRGSILCLDEPKQQLKKVCVVFSVMSVNVPLGYLIASITSA
jgi:hypothetical protein